MSQDHKALNVFCNRIYFENFALEAQFVLVPNIRTICKLLHDFYFFWVFKEFSVNRRSFAADGRVQTRVEESVRGHSVHELLHAAQDILPTHWSNPPHPHVHQSVPLRPTRY